ncbi:MAG: carboxypeptidase-like regulatory domain-containing protein [Chitinophagaceae bacterium]|nr:carboxypeptidase-like regulatory domain-containing protein [Chitinophagaceae bacterium]
MAKRLQLTIPEPCHENWDAMTPVEKGRFCNACQKQVTDFTHMSDRQLGEFFKKPSTGSGCGRFLNSQLERDIEIPRKRIPWLKYFFTVALPAFLLSLKPGSVKAQGQVWVKTNETTEKPLNVSKVKEQQDTTRIMLSGVVKNDLGDPCPGTAVRIKGTRVGVAADENGRFKISVKRGDILVISGASIYETEVTVGNSNDITVIMKPKKAGEYIVCTMVGGYSSYTSIKRKITGFVTDEQGKPLQGVWVTGKKRKIIATTDAKGKFSVQVDRKDILLFSNPGFDKQELKTGKSDTVHVKLAKAIDPENKTADQNLFELKLYPNPVRTGAPVTFDFNVSPVKGIYQWILQNTSGQVAHQAPLRLSGYEEKVSLNMPNVQPGNYFLVLLDPVSSIRYSQPIVVVR